MAVVEETTMAIEMVMIVEITDIMITPLFLAAVTVLIVEMAVTMDMTLVATTTESTATEITTVKCILIVITTGGIDTAEDTMATTMGMSMVEDITIAMGIVTAVDMVTTTITMMEDITTITT